MDELDAMRAMIAEGEAALAEHLAPEDAAAGTAWPGLGQASTTEPARTEVEEDPDVLALADRIMPLSRTRRAELLGHAAQAPTPRADLAAAILERRR
jgi:hypothetical protein